MDLFKQFAMMKRCGAAFALLLALCVQAFAQNPNTAKFPGAVAADSDLYVATNGASTTLNGSVDDSTASIVLTSGTKFVAPVIISIDSEILHCSSLSTNTLTCTRGGEGTTAASHSSGANVYGYLTAYHHNQIASEVKATEAYAASLEKYGTRASLPGTVPAANSVYRCTDCPYTFISNGTAWIPYINGFQVTEPILSDFTQVNTSGTTFDTTHGGIRWLTTNSSGSVSDRLLLKASPGSGAYYVDIGFIGLLTPDTGGIGGAINGGFGPVFAGGTTTSSAFEHFQWGGNNGVLQGVVRAYSTVTSTPSVVQSGGAYPIGSVMWMRIYDDGTNRKYYFCGDLDDGSNCFQFYSVTRTTTFTPADVGVGFEPFNVNGYIWLLHFNVCSGAPSSSCW